MALETMYAPQANSPATTTTGAMTTGTLTVDVLDASILPAAPMLLVFGGESENAETVLVSAINGNTLTISQRAVEGTARAWAEGTTVARLFTAKDLSDVQTNIGTLNTNKLETTGDGSSVTATFSTAASKADVSSGDTLATLFSKLKKWYASFGNLAWVNSLSSSDVGLGNVDNVQQYSASNPPPYPVTSVNGSTGAVTVAEPDPSNATPAMDGTGAAGTSADYSRADHVHPADTSKADLNSNSKVDADQASAYIISISSNTTLSSTHYGCCLSVTGTRTITIPTGLEIGIEIEIMNMGTGTVTVAGATGVSLNGVSAGSVTIPAQYTSGVLKCMSSNSWVIQGAIS